MCFKNGCHGEVYELIYEAVSKLQDFIVAKYYFLSYLMFEKKLHSHLKFGMTSPCCSHRFLQANFHLEAQINNTP